MDFAAIITALLTGIGAIITIWLGFKKQKLEISTQNDILLKKVNETDLVQSERITTLENNYKELSEKLDKPSDNVDIMNKLTTIEKDLSALNEIHKHSTFAKVLIRDIENNADATMQYKELKNDELKKGINNIVSKTIQVFEDVLLKDFTVDVSRVKDKITNALTSLKTNMNVKKLCSLNVSPFLDNIENDIIKNHTEMFIIKLSSIIIEKTNGKRREAFALIANDLIINVISDIILNFNKIGLKQVA